jgi:hypothetical protein
VLVLGPDYLGDKYVRGVYFVLYYRSSICRGVPPIVREEMKTLIIDYDVLKYRYGFAAQQTVKPVLETDDVVIIADKPHEVCAAVGAGIRRMLRATGATDYIGYLSGTGNFRLDIDPEYKANRKDMVKPYHFGTITDFLIHMHDAIVVDGIEADDAIAIQYLKDPDNQIIATVDKDLDQIPGFHYNFVTDNLYFQTEEDAVKVLYTSMLVGDRVDNIKGVKGIGPVKAEKLLAECKSEDELAHAVYMAYQGAFGEENAQAMYDKNYKLLYLLRSEEEIPE